MTTDEERYAAFDRLQAGLLPLWQSIQSFNSDPQTIVVVPSINVEGTIRGVVQEAYEERYLFLLLLLRQPRARLIYVTSQAVHPDVVDYYLDLLPGVIASHARRRLFLVSPLDGSSRPLAEKLLARPRLLAEVRSLIPDAARAHLVPFNATTMERDIALSLGIPMYGTDPRHAAFGSKSGARRLFADEGVPHPLGVEGLTTEDDLVRALVDISAKKPALAGCVVKLNEGVSGEGNATVSLAGLRPTGQGRGLSDDEARRAIRAMRFELAGTAYDDYLARLAARGGIIEERISGREFRSPSAQLRITPAGIVEELSTHDQVLGGPSGQSYLGCRFPADPAYAPAIMREAAKVGRRLQREGVLGRFALDFVACRSADGGWDVYAIEINLRKGGTTHPFLTLQFLTDGRYDSAHSRFLTPRGEAKAYLATDHLQHDAYRTLTHHDLFDLVMEEGLHFDETRATGVVLHMVNAVGETGQFGFTAFANTPAEADGLYQRMVAAVNRRAGVQPS